MYRHYGMCVDAPVREHPPLPPPAAHPHQADVDSLIRLINVHNVLHATNPTTALALMQTIKLGVEGQPGLIPSFFRTLASPAVAEYKAGQAALLADLAKANEGRAAKTK